MFTTTYLVSGWYEEFLKWIPEGEIFNLRVVFEAIPGILKELPNTILLTLAGAFFGLLLALLFAIVKINRVKILYPIQALFVSFLRGTPILVQLMLTYYGIPLLLKAINQQYGTAFNINDVPAYASETIRAAILSVDAGEIEAAKSLGMTNAQVYRRIIIPNAAVVATPTLINSLIGLTKGTSLAFYAGVLEIFAQAKIMSGNDSRYFERFISVSLIYWAINILIEQLGRWIEQVLSIKDPKVVTQTLQEEERAA